jgi:hypothetical protein
MPLLGPALRFGTLSGLRHVLLGGSGSVTSSLRRRRTSFSMARPCFPQLVRHGRPSLWNESSE